MQVGDYQISNFLIGAVLLTTVGGLGIATGAAGSVADVVSDTFIPGGNATQAPDTGSGSEEVDQNTDTGTGTSNNQDVGDGDGSTSSGGGSTDSGGESTGSGDDSTSNQGSDTGSQQEDNQQQDNQQQDDQQQETENIQTSAAISAPANGQIYNTANIDLQASVEAANASYEVLLDGALKQSGQLDGNKDISSTLSVNSDGTHNIKVLAKRSGDTLVSKEAQFSVSSTSVNTSTGSASINLFDPSSQTYSTNNVPLSASLEASDASYEVVVDGVTKTSGSIQGTKNLNTDLNIVSGSHNLEVIISDSQGTLASESVSLTVDTGSSGTQRTGFYTPDQLNSGDTALIRLYNSQGNPVEGETVTAGSLGDYTTNQFGEIQFQVPQQNTITVSSSNYEKTYDITQTTTEPDIILINPIDTESFDTPTGTQRDITFEADAEITEDSGTASLIIDGSEVYTQDLSLGTNTISTTQALSGGTHNWQVEVDTPEYNVTSSSRSLTVNEVEVQNGLSLQNNATAREYNYVRLYDSGEPVEGQQITVNGDSIGSTDSNGEVGFEVPNAQEITVEASGYSSITESVEGYTPESPVSIELLNPANQSEVNDYRTTFDYTVETSNNFQTSIILDGRERYSSSGPSNSNFQKTLIIGDSGTHDLKLRVSQDGSEYYKNISFSTTQDIPEPTLNTLVPQDETTLQTYRPEVGADYSLGPAHQTEILLDGNQIFSSSYPDGTTGFKTQREVLKKGTHDIEINIEYTNFTKTVNFIQGSFSTDQNIPPGRIERKYPLNDFAGPGGEFKFNVTAYYDSTYRLIVENASTKNVLKEASIDSPNGITNGKEVSITYSYPWEQNGDKEWYVEVEGGSMIETSEKLLLSNAGLNN